MPFIIFQIFFKGVRALQESKKYVLRTVNLNVNNARKDILENLKDHEILLERDWAMKFIPMEYRELQSNWFGKRRLNWHITVGTFRSGKAMDVTLTPLFTFLTLQHKMPTLLMQSSKTA